MILILLFKINHFKALWFLIKICHKHCICQNINTYIIVFRSIFLLQNGGCYIHHQLHRSLLTTPRTKHFFSFRTLYRRFLSTIFHMYKYYSMYSFRANFGQFTTNLFDEFSLKFELRYYIILFSYFYLFIFIKKIHNLTWKFIMGGKCTSYVNSFPIQSWNRNHCTVAKLRNEKI